MMEVQSNTAPTEPNPKGLFGMRIFRLKTPPDRRGSVDSNASPRSSYDSIDQAKSRKSSLSNLFRKKSASNEPPVPKSGAKLEPTKSKDSTKLKKQKDLSANVDPSDPYQRDKQTGERVVDHTTLLHSLVHQGSTDSVPRLKQFKNDDAEPGQRFLTRLPMKVWTQVFDALSLADHASLAITCKAFRQHLPISEAELQLAENESERTDYLRRLDYLYPDHLFCFACNTYHRRLNPRKESLKPTNVANPVFDCPYYSNPEKRVSRVRITSGRTLPFTFAQLLIRAHRFSPNHGIHIDSLSKRWKERDTKWNHITRYAVIKDHLLVRVTSTSFAAPDLPPAGLRNLLYNPHEEFNPYFSTCPHWRDGVLMPVVKCALSHIPKGLEGSGVQRVGAEIQARLGPRKSSIVSLCGECRPIRRCPECATEYLIEIKMAEDKSEPDPTKMFKQALVITRWSDLGDGSTPTASREWAACAGTAHDFDSFEVLGRRAISGVFESHFTAEVIPPQNLLNMNPNKHKLGEAGHDWY